MTISGDPNIAALDIVATALSPLLDELVLVGGCAVGLLITDASRPIARVTLDVDLVAEGTTKGNYVLLCERIRGLGFREHGEVICRWIKNGIVVDIMPSDESILGFTNHWYALTLSTYMTATLPSGLVVRHASPPLFIATKLESFNDRGNGDYLHHDVEDIINIVDGRPELIDEIKNAPPDVRSFIRQEIDGLLAQSSFIDRLPGHLGPTLAEQARVEIVIERLRQIAGL